MCCGTGLTLYRESACYRAEVRRHGFTDGLLFLGLGAVILIVLVVPIILIGVYVFRMPYDQVAGIVAGACGNPAILAFTNKLAPTERPTIAYAMIFPGTTILKILFVDIIPMFWGR